MKKILILSVIIIVLAIGALGAYNYYKESQIISLKESMLTEQSTKCTFSKENSYIEKVKSGNKSWTKTIENGSTGYVVNDGSSSYMWPEGGTTGFKLVNPPSESIDQATQIDLANRNNEYWESLGYDIWCEKTKSDEGLFIAPQNVKFSELSEQVITEEAEQE